MSNFIEVKSDPNRARLDLLDQLVAEMQSTESPRNATPVVGTIRSTQQATPRPLNRERQSILPTVSSPLRPAYGNFQTIDSSRRQWSAGRNIATEKPAQPFENGNVPDVLSEESSGEKILPVFGPSLKSNSAASNRTSASRMRPHSPRISSPLGRTEGKSDGVFPLNELLESSSEEEIVLLERSRASSLPRNTPQGRTPMGHNPKASPERTLRASLIASTTPTPVHCPRPLKGWEQSDVHARDSGRMQGNASSPRKPPARGHLPFEYIRSGGRVSPKTLVGQSLWQQPYRRSPSGWVDRRPVSPTPSITRHTHRGTLRSFSKLAQHPMFQSAADLQVLELERMSSGEETFYGAGSLSDIHDLDLEGLIAHDDPHRFWPIAGGGHSDIYRGKLTLSSSRKIRIAIKMIRLPDYEPGQLPAQERLKRLIREADVWSKLEHENVLPFIGVYDDVRIAPYPVLISPFCGFGHVGRYLSKNPSANRDHLVFLLFEHQPSYLFLQVYGVASGLKFLHDNDIVHGDLKVQNVLVDKRGVPCICDFGISKILNHRGYTTLSVGTVPYMAPELFLVIGRDNTSGGLPSTTKQSDVYSFALLALEILTSEPLKRRPSEAMVTFEGLQSLRPKREDYDLRKVSREYWLVLDRCWAFEPPLRPSSGEVLSSLPISRRDSNLNR
ncbi:kinase-like domain-containing protein [Mycena albidolilacea]|uniref:Kinase-like domain-containing protein n=1 Tax=Mycena albidolilacea TaxID=1033008 RepID=A0AAD7AQS3_9AGAR|nr:kinase-like domain-containing protein [Mycena albidolilacea]